MKCSSTHKKPSLVIYTKNQFSSNMQIDWYENKNSVNYYQNCIYRFHYKVRVPVKPQGSGEHRLNTVNIGTCFSCLMPARMTFLFAKIMLLGFQDKGK